MKNTLLKLLGWLEGRKTYVLVTLICLTAVALVFFRQVTPATALAVALVFLGLVAASFRAVLEKHHDEVLQGLTEVAALGAAVATHKTGAIEPLAVAVAQDGYALGSEIEQESTAK